MLYRFAQMMIEEIEHQVEEIIQQDEELNTLYQLLQTIVGIGPVIALMLIVYTEGFSRFDTWRKFASYIGIAPFEHLSGSSIKGKTKVSRLAYRELKGKLYMGATKAIDTDPQLKAYYNRKKNVENKHHLKVMNAVMNKLIARAFAVAKRKTPYVIMM